MGRFLSGFALPMLLLTAALLNWSLMSLVDLLAFLSIQYAAPKNGFQSQRLSQLSWCTLIFSSLAVLSHAIFHIIWAVKGDQWSVSDAQWAKLVGFLSIHTWSLQYEICFMVIQISAAFVAVIGISGSRSCLDLWKDTWWGHLYSFVIHIGSRLRVLCCLLLPFVQLVVGISHPSWASLPFFICSCIGLIKWSITSNFLGLLQWWRYLLLYSGLNIVLLYAYQLPIEFSGMIQCVAGFIGLYKISAKSEWSEICSCLSLLLFYIMLSCIRNELIEMDFIMSPRESSLSERLLLREHSFFIYESRYSVRHTNDMLRGEVFQTFSVNFFTYGFPIFLLSLSFWSFQFASLCAFGLLAHVGYIISAFPSLFRLHQLNGLLLIFILLWAATTYVFNVAFMFLIKKMWKDTEIWETLGLWHYPIPGLYLLAQFCLGVLVALGNLVNNSVFLYLSDGERESSSDHFIVEENEETKVLIVATIAWGLRKSSRAITLLLIFFIALKPGIIHAVYMAFFLIYLLSHNISWKIRQSLIVLCEAHFALLYILQLDLISKALEQKHSFARDILSQLGFLSASSGDFLKIATLACSCAIHNHGFEMLSSFSAILQHSPCPPFGFSILRAGLIKSVLLSVFTSTSKQSLDNNTSHDKRIVSYLEAIGLKFRSVYRSCGTYIAFLTILFTVYLVKPNFISFGYLFFLLLWMTGRQLIGKTKRRLWLPLKVYAVLVFILIYGFSVFFSSQIWLLRMVDVSSVFGYNPEASMLENIWQSLAVLIVMQLYSYERRQSKFPQPIDGDAPEKCSLSFVKRLLILHIEKILDLALFYASLCPIGAFGFLYLFGLAVCSTLPKSSWIPSKLFLVYSGFLVMFEYLFQLWGDCAEMLPGQNNYSLSLFLGLQFYKPGFSGLESGLRGKILVIVSCILQYNVFNWLERMPCNFGNGGRWEEPCTLFGLAEEAPSEATNLKSKTKHPLGSGHLIEKETEEINHTWPSFSSFIIRGLDATRGFEDSNPENYSNACGSSKENHKWNRRRSHILRKERLHLQMTTLKACVKFWIENIFNFFGLEINMVALLLASFAVLNSISLLYVASLAACILLPQHIMRKLWPIFVFLFGSVIILEYLAIWLNQLSWKQHDAGIVVDDPRMLISYYAVFMLSCFKYRADRLSSLSASETYQQMMSQYKNASLNDLLFERKFLWTFLDYLKLYSYCHLLDLVLTLILITGTLEFDILHLGYLGFALVFFRMRLEILKKNEIFKFLRIYNFAVIVLSLAYQSPFVGGSCKAKCEMIDYISEIVGFYKYDYGFRITSRSALVEIIIFMLISLQSYMFSAQEFDYVSEYLEAEQIGSIVQEQEKKAAWKTSQLQQIQKSEEEKQLRNFQVEKLKSDLLNLQIQLQNISFTANFGNAYQSQGNRMRKSVSADAINKLVDKLGIDFKKQTVGLNSDFLFSFDVNESPRNKSPESPSVAHSRKHSLEFTDGIIELTDKAATSEFWDSHERDEDKFQAKKASLMSAVNLFNDGVNQVQSLSNMAVANIVSFFNIKNELDLGDDCSDDEVYYETENENIGCEPIDSTFSMQSGDRLTTSQGACMQIGMILHYMWAQMRSNNDAVCYCCFVLIFMWNFSLFSMVYPAVLFLYALCVSTGPNNMFWIIMLIYTEMDILLQYIYQIIIQHCGLTFNMRVLQELGFPEHKITSSFVISNLPLFVVYLFTLLQTSITARDSEWATIPENSFRKRRNKCQKEAIKDCWMIIESLHLSAKSFVEQLISSLYRYWKSLTQGAETPPFFVQLSMKVDLWPRDGIQPERIKSGINKMLKIMHDKRCQDMGSNHFHSISRVRVQSIERSPENENVALAVLEVLHASPLKECSEGGFYKSLTPAADVAYEILEAERNGVVNEIGFPYPILSVIGGGKKHIDLYAYTFCADLAVFFLVAIFYQSIMKNNIEFLEVYQLEDQFPKEFVFILMVIFFLIVVDRIIYLCSFATGKVIFYFINFFLFTYSIANYASHIDLQHRHAARYALRAIYFTKAISLALQAVQIRFGIPHKSTLYRQFLTSSISQINYLGFRLYRALPFLYELRCVLDWSCTTTSLTMYDWLKLEDIHASLFLVKCDADLNKAKHRQGEKQSKTTKFCNGICFFFILLCVIWAPMLMYSSGNPTNIANPIKEASIRIDIRTTSGRLTLFETTLCEKFSWNGIGSHVDLDPQGYLRAYDEKDVQLICCQADGSSLWLVPPVVQDRYMNSLRWSMDVIFSWQLTRDRPKGKEVVRYDLIVQDEDLPTYSEVMAVLNGTTSSFRIHNVYPRYFRVTGSGEVRILEELVDLVSGDLVLNRGNLEWWSFHDIDAASVCGQIAGPMAIIVSEETPQGILGETLSKFSIWGLYITFVLAVGRFIRLQFSDLRMRIPFENLPSCDRLLSICEDIYAAREEGELEVEEVLYWTLVKIYRSSHMLLEYTKPD
ncbi:piezo-type mechanosensitive ion channel homolog isoform X3 [Jatropha curcas]|uniref:piezo-type mechanosensitive ion channel homolog isoform X3 n=1 Tax=Jatropha curcas TaxID=180498 RepID=UPI0018950C0C|nr:piezo-type mechanosensitive ion channel homolog isoform X3 [Jatropha curcas]